jgi:ABC-2 type transport system permease protein
MNERPSLTRLVKVELRKMVDTRAGFWLQLAVVALTVVATVIAALAGHDQDHTFREILKVAVQPAGILLPVVGILLVSSEWSQRTAIVSFALVPDRGRLIAAKALAGVVLGVIATAIALVVAAGGTALAGSSAPHVWSLPLGLLGQDLLYVVSAMLTGVGFGAALLASAPAIVLYFGLPAAFGALGSIHALRKPAEWVTTESLGPLTEGILGGTAWGQVGTTLLLWMALPLAIGFWRIARGDLN